MDVHGMCMTVPYAVPHGATREFYMAEIIWVGQSFEEEYTNYRKI